MSGNNMIDRRTAQPVDKLTTGLFEADASNSITFASREEWLAGRRQGIGGSDAAAALGESPWTSPYALWADKSGLLAMDEEATERMEWGLLFEPVICERFSNRFQRPLKRDPPYTIRVHRDFPWMRATLDAIQWAGPNDKHLPTGPGVLQVKCADAAEVARWKREYDGQPPLMYDIQLQHEIDVAGFEWGSLVILAGGNKLVGPFDHLRDERFLVAHRANLKLFWDCVQEKRPPQIDGSESSAKALARMFPSDNGQVITFSPAAAIADAKLVRCKARIKKLEECKTLYENTLKAELESATVGVFPSGGKYTYSTIAACTYTTTRKQHRRLTRSK